MQDSLTPREVERSTAFFDQLFGFAPERIIAAQLDKQNAARLSVVALYGRGTVAYDAMRQADGETRRIKNSCFSFAADKTYPRLYRLRTPVQAGIVGREVYVAFEDGKDNLLPVRKMTSWERDMNSAFGYGGSRW